MTARAWSDPEGGQCRHAVGTGVATACETNDPPFHQRDETRPRDDRLPPLLVAALPLVLPGGAEGIGSVFKSGETDLAERLPLIR